MNNFLLGSSWRKWDLHIHTPDSYDYKDKSVTNKDIIDVLIKEDISVVAITDHHIINPERIRSLQALAADKITILPGIEFCSDSRGNEPIHFIGIFPENSNIDYIWTELKSKTGIAAKEQIKENNEIYCDLKQSSQLIREFGGVVSIHAGTKSNSIEEITNSLPVTMAEKKDIVDLIDIFELGQDRDQFDYINKVFPRIGKYPMIICSDNHNAKLYNLKQNCWIKADPTFEGLKQIIYEPEDRVKIQSNSPYEDRKKVFFENISLDGSTNFILPNTKIPFNRELITLIGGRGSGKSALLELIAFLNEEHLHKDINGKKKIIEFYRDNDQRSDPPPGFLLKTILVNKDGDKQDFQKSLKDKDRLELPLLYLGQEQLSKMATNDGELTKTVCDLIGIDAAEFNQQELISKARETLAKIRIDERTIADITQAFKDIGYKEGEDLEKWIETFIKKLRDQQIRLSSKETKSTLEEINKKTQEGIKLKELIVDTDFVINTLKNLEVNETLALLDKKTKTIYPNFQLTRIDTNKQVNEIRALQEKAKSDMSRLRIEITEKKNDLIRLGIKEDVNTLLQSSEALQRQIGSAEKDLESYRSANQEIKNAKAIRNAILPNIISSLERLKSQISTKFSEFQLSRVDSSPEERELFERIISGIGIDGEVVFDERKICHDLLNYIDNRKIQNESELKKHISGENIDGTPKDLTIESIIEWVKSDLAGAKIFNRGGDEKAIEYILTEWPEFLHVRAVVRLNGKPTETLSIGQRGTLLLKVYLSTATARQVFIIDQPEDNLDNNFIVNELIPLIRKAKKSRQIIMSTHNANLVVNADSDQIIIARLDIPDSYLSGSIENPTINTNIRNILEGGEEAFRQREKKYGMVSK